MPKPFPFDQVQGESGREAGIRSAFGLKVISDFLLPGSGPIAAAHADLTIRKGPAELAADAEVSPPYRRSGACLELAIGSVGRFLLAEKGVLEVQADQDVDPQLLGAFLVASGLPMLLWQRGGLVLHATGVLLNGQAIAIAGRSGAGKTSLARLLIAQGARLIGDDSLWLPPGSIKASGLNGGQFLRTTVDSEPAFHPLAPEQQAGPAPLRAIFVLSPEEPERGLSRLAPVAAVSSLLNSLHRPKVPNLLGQRAQLLAECTRIAATVPVWAIGIGTGEGGLAKVAATICDAIGDV
jgi:hypothetical protein